LFGPANPLPSRNRGDAFQIVEDFARNYLKNTARRQRVCADTTWCTTIKNRGIQIAVHYTEYLPLPTNSWYNSWIAPFQTQIGPNMESCASTGMFFTVTTDGDITAAMQALFQQAIAAARLTK
jgi:hypothetical protein